jgi:ribosomal protein L37AE/L43A
MKLRQRKRHVRLMRASVPRKNRCPECGERGLHFVQLLASGFWTCAKFYGPDGQRL